ncbi:hypothetical protein DUNSADRAFT_13411, partial [Dunaliella salina]
MASIQSLPLELVGYIFSWLPRSCSDRSSFLSCCKALHQAQNIQEQFSRLYMFATKLSNGRQNPFLCFPQAGKLKTLVLLRGREGSTSDNPGTQLLQLLQPRGTVQGRARVMQVLKDVQELRVWGFPLHASSAAVGTAFGLYAQLRTLQIDGRCCDSATFLMAFAALNGKCGLRELDITLNSFGHPSGSLTEQAEAIKALSNIRSLRALTLRTEFLGTRNNAISSISSLTKLKSLNLDFVDVESEDELGDLHSIFRNMQRLKFLSMPELLCESVLAELAGSIETLVDTECKLGSKALDDALHDIAWHIHKFPVLKIV